MSRLGDTIRNERLRLGLNPKALAKKCGVSEKFLLEVESGKRIIQDTEAARILKVMGKQQSVLADFEAVADGCPPPPLPGRAPAVPKQEKAQPQGEPSQTWVNALSGIVRAVPIRGLSQQPLGEKLTPTQGGKILGAPADKVFYLQMPDNSMAGYRIRKDDLVLMTPFTSLEEGGVYLIEENGVTGLYKVTPRAATACCCSNTNLNLGPARRSSRACACCSAPGWWSFRCSGKAKHKKEDAR